MNKYSRLAKTAKETFPKAEKLQIIITLADDTPNDFRLWSLDNEKKILKGELKKPHVYLRFDKIG